MSKTKQLSLAVLIGIGFAALAVFTIFTGLRSSNASAISGLPATIRTSTTTQVGRQGIRAVASSTQNCSSRIISTGGEDIAISFGEVTNGAGKYVVASTTIGNGVGHPQYASTTVVYDSGTYGCGEWYIYGFEASTTITITETN